MDNVYFNRYKKKLLQKSLKNFNLSKNIRYCNTLEYEKK